MAYNVGIIGYGWAATAHIDAINGTSQGSVSAVYSSRELNGEEVSAKHGSAITPYQDLGKMLEESQVDVVSITSYPNQHRAQAIAAAEAGKHIILEKPIALTWEDCTAIRDAIKANGVKACVCFELRFISQFQTIKSLIDSGIFGDLHYGEIDYYHGIGPWYGQYRWNTTKENGGSSLLSAGCHALDAALLCLGEDVEEVTTYACQSKNAIFDAYEYPTTTTSLLKFASGRVGKVASVIDCLQPYYFHTHLVGSEGSLLDNKIYSSKLALRDKKWTELPVALADSGDVADHPYQAQFQSFFDALDRGEDMPLTNFDSALQTFRVLFACDKSVAEGRPVKVSEI
ncbi:MAG TPA: Gfo/Idh/MocA family oxidoreductase [Verrucomicrobiales bacterium]|nr:Gfo/Idh/MocA family oxidoreductase [Verrucomicrobiae bacterium]MCP5555608.1 Gfo/Idh/MocA family oxidoreductase [Akkermansiaceae bacterium]HRX57093.1 Gfo/Idh/MocA family oxidoreductase [Verrucomicrobiales bacterium]